ncbi:MAG: DNA translocase FtsK 4TM domain-containing protein, partial [Paracoccaceae bacterium]
MASYQVRQRDPLLDQGTAAMLERRGRELLGIGLIALSLMFLVMFYSYSPNDPGWMVATDEPAANALGRFGAAMASTLIIIGGKGAWGIPVVLAIWGARFVLHRGADRALGRMVFAVIAIALGSVYAATLVPGADWPHSFGLGGLFGDTVLGATLGVLPFGAGFGLKVMSVLAALSFLGMLLFVTGFDIPELRALARFLIHGLIFGYSALLGLATQGAQGTARAATALAERRRASMAATQTARDAVVSAPPTFGRPAALKPTALRADPRYPEPLAEAAHYAPPREKMSLLARMPQLLRRAEPELVESVLPEAAGTNDMPSPDRIRARITDVINARTAQPAALAPLQAAIAARREPPVMRATLPRGPIPLIADTRPIPAPTPAPLTEWDDEDEDDLAIAADWQADLPPLRATPMPD